VEAGCSRHGGLEENRGGEAAALQPNVAGRCSGWPETTDEALGSGRALPATAVVSESHPLARWPAWGMVDAAVDPGRGSKCTGRLGAQGWSTLRSWPGKSVGAGHHKTHHRIMMRREGRGARISRSEAGRLDGRAGIPSKHSGSGGDGLISPPSGGRTLRCRAPAAVGDGGGMHYVC